ncbi:MAG: hypothetical protein R3Y10_07430 [Ferrimonas sp.]
MQSIACVGEGAVFITAAAWQTTPAESNWQAAGAAQVALMVAELKGDGHFVGTIADDGWGEALQQRLQQQPQLTVSVNINGDCSPCWRYNPPAEPNLKGTWLEYRADGMVPQQPLKNGNPLLPIVDWYQIAIGFFNSSSWRESQWPEQTLQALERAHQCGVVVVLAAFFPLSTAVANGKNVPQPINPSGLAQWAMHFEASWLFVDVALFQRHELQALAAQQGQSPTLYVQRLSALGVSLIFIFDEKHGQLIWHAQHGHGDHSFCPSALPWRMASERFCAAFLWQLQQSADPKFALSDPLQLQPLLRFACHYGCLEGLA